MKPVAREFTTREEEKRPMVWQPPPSGGVLGLNEDEDWTFRYCNTDVQGDTRLVDTMHARKLLEGWTPVDPKDHPQLQAPHLASFIKGDRFVRNGQILMKMPKQMADSRRDYYMMQDRKKRNTSMADLLAAQAPEGFKTANEIGNTTTSVKVYRGENARNI